MTHIKIALLAVAVIFLGNCSAQQLTSDTSYAKVRDKYFFIDDDSLAVFRLREAPPGNDSALFNPEYGTLVPLFSFSPDSSKILVVVRHAVDAHSYIIVQVKTKQWKVYGSEPSRVYWSRDSKCVAVHEYYLNEAQKIRVVDFSVSPPLVTVVKDSIQPNDKKKFGKIFWSQTHCGGKKRLLHYEIISQEENGKTDVREKVFRVR